MYTSFLQAANPRPNKLTAAIFHGAGGAHSGRHEGLAEIFADNGISVISLDFLGHGKTGGNVHDSSLALRTGHAKAAIGHWTDESVPLILCGFSMSGHTVLRLLPDFRQRVRSIGLFCPAMYAAEAEDVQFGPAFTRVIRTPESWRSSPGLREAANFKGRAAIVLGSKDEVIPWNVVSELTHSLKQNAERVRLDIAGGVEHRLAKWLSEQREFSTEVIHYLAGNYEDRDI